VDGFVLPHKFQHAFDQAVATIIAKISEFQASAKMGFAVCVTPGAIERALARDLDGKHRKISGQDIPPGKKQVGRSETWIWSRRRHIPSHMGV
jgi:hypothetical protein